MRVDESRELANIHCVDISDYRFNKIQCLMGICFNLNKIHDSVRKYSIILSSANQGRMSVLTHPRLTGVLACKLNIIEICSCLQSEL
jgi:hypothetical protein